MSLGKSTAEASKDGHLAASVVYPSGLNTREQLKFVDSDGDDLKISQTKQELFTKVPHLIPDDYNLVLVKDGDSIIMKDDKPLLHYQKKILAKYIIKIQPRAQSAIL